MKHAFVVFARHDHIPIVLPRQFEQLLHSLLFGIGGMDDAAHQLVAEEVCAADSATGEEECGQGVRANAEVTRQPVQHVAWQRLLHRVSLLWHNDQANQPGRLRGR